MTEELISKWERAKTK